MPNAFISHSSPDDGYVAELDSLLTALGFEVFNDVRSVKPDATFWPEIEAGIRKCDVFFVVITRASMNSKWVMDEIAFADSIQKEVRPVWIEDCELPARFSDRDVIDFRPKNRAPERKIAPSRLSRHAAKQFFGREAELELLDQAWADPGMHVLSIVAWGGVGKTSLVNRWIATRMIAKSWPGVERYYDWSFYSQGTGDSRQTSSALFINEALKFFGDPDPTLGTEWERGERLARLVREHKTLLVLDGIEPLQYPPTDRSRQAGRLKDKALEALLQSLVQENNGLCIVTTREHLTNIESLPTQQEHKLDKLMLEAAIGLIRHLQLIGTDEQIKEMWDALDGHALSMLQLGRLLARGYGRDLRKWREMGFTKADKLKQGRSTMRVMSHYESWLASGDKEQQLELAILRLMGLFEKPMSPGCFGALRATPTIAGLTELFAGLENFEVEAAVTTLIENELLSHCGGEDFSGSLLDVHLDAHPLIREYFAVQLKRDKPEAFQAAHSRLFDYLCENTPHRPDGLDGLAPLYEAVSHGCLAERHQEACDNVYFDRINRGGGSDGFYSTKKLGAFGADLAAVVAFFDRSSTGPWSQVSPNLTAADQAWLLSVAAFNLRALGRLTEALEPMRAGLEMAVQQKDWENAAIRASSLSEFKVTLGRLPDALTDARQSITYADQSGDAFQRMARRTTAADALHQSGQRAEAGTLFADAERMQQEMQTQFDLLYSNRGFRYCDWLLDPAQRAAWQHLLASEEPHSLTDSEQTAAILACTEVERRAKYALNLVLNGSRNLLDVGLNNLTLARVGLNQAILTNPLPQPMLDLPHVAAAVNGLRAAGAVEFLTDGLLTASLYHFVRGEHDLARKHLTEAQQIAERGPLPLFLADIHLHRARMFHDRDELAKAANLIRSLGYGRRYEELTDAEEAAKQWTS
jgi:tetratricopeptide (TPR) repeat protein